MRHSKSGWDNSSLQDFDRPLSDQGIRDAYAMGKFFHKSGNMPGLLISSPAERARQTCNLFAEGALLDENIVSWNRSFYYGSEMHYLEAINNAPDEHELIMLIGHNPLLEKTAGILAGVNNKLAVKMSTTALVTLESFAETWKTIHPGTCQITGMVTPELLNF